MSVLVVKRDENFVNSAFVVKIKVFKIIQDIAFYQPPFKKCTKYSFGF